MTPEEKNVFKHEILREVALTIPDIIGNLLMEVEALKNIKQDFYKKHPEFNDRKDVVSRVIAEMGGNDPRADLDDIFKRAPAEIRRHLDTLENCDLSKVDMNPDRSFEKIISPSITQAGTNGAL
jgi:hypothetical protein